MRRFPLGDGAWRASAKARGRGVRRASAASRVAATGAWLDAMVIGLRLCPYAAAVQAPPRLRITACEAEAADDAVAAVAAEAAAVLHGEAQHHTTLLVFDGDSSLDLHSWQQFVRLSWRLQSEGLVANGFEKELQLVLFHPAAVHSQYASAGGGGDPGDFSTRAPHPTVHLLREADVLEAVRADHSGKLETLPARWVSPRCNPRACGRAEPTRAGIARGFGAYSCWANGAGYSDAACSSTTPTTASPTAKATTISASTAAGTTTTPPTTTSTSTTTTAATTTTTSTTTTTDTVAAGGSDAAGGSSSSSAAGIGGGVAAGLALIAAVGLMLLRRKRRAAKPVLAEAGAPGLAQNGSFRPSPAAQPRCTRCNAQTRWCTCDAVDPAQGTFVRSEDRRSIRLVRHNSIPHAGDSAAPKQAAGDDVLLRTNSVGEQGGLEMVVTNTEL